MFNLEFLAVIRANELDAFERALPKSARVLELGGGTGQQALMLAERGFDVVSIDVQASEYREHRVFPVLDYDGRNLPFADDSFDAVFSSNVLEHVLDLRSLMSEQARVLRPGGVGVHAMPTHGWRFWTSVTHYIDVIQRLIGSLPGLLPRSLSPSGLLLAPLQGAKQCAAILIKGAVPQRHGERGNVITELAYFHPSWWQREFEAQGYSVLEDHSMGLFYTGYMSLGPRLCMDKRRRLSRVLGSACHLFTISPQERAGKKDG